MNMSSVKLKGLRAKDRAGTQVREPVSTNCLSEMLHTFRLVTWNEILMHAEEEAIKGLSESNDTSYLRPGYRKVQPSQSHSQHTDLELF